MLCMTIWLACHEPPDLAVLGLILAGGDGIHVCMSSGRGNHVRRVGSGGGWAMRTGLGARGGAGDQYGPHPLPLSRTREMGRRIVAPHVA